MLDDQLAIYCTRIMGGAYSVWVDGRLVDTGLSDWRIQWNRPLLVKIPSAPPNVTNAAVDVYLAVPYRLAQGYSVGSIYTGPFASLKPNYERRLFFQWTLPMAGIPVSLVLGLISLQFWFSRRSDDAYLYLALASASWFICNVQWFIDFSDSDIASRWYGAIVDASVTWVILLCYTFAFRFDRRSYPRVERALLILAVVLTVTTLPIWGLEVSALQFQHYFNLVAGVGITVFIIWLAFHGGSLEFKAIGIALLSMPILGAHDLLLQTTQVNPDGAYLFQYCTFTLFGAFLYALNRRYLGALQDIEGLNASLDQRLRQREAELEVKHSQLLKYEQEQALLKERQRLMQDMHDGIGAMLMSTLAVAKRGGLPEEQVANVLQDCIDELKITIDSLEPVDHDLVALLASLRFRLGKRVESMGVRIKWTMGEVPPLAWLGPPQALQILRILQEALTNVLKHAQATELRISTHMADQDDHPHIQVEIADNGVGFDEVTGASGTGRRGLKNMQTRARELGGSLTWASVPGQGTKIRLNLPLEQT